MILYFYPEADTPGCTIEAKGFRDRYAEFLGRKVAVVGVSTDDCPAQKAFAVKYGLPFPLIADRSKEVARTFGVLNPKGKAARVSFFLDADGRVTEIVRTSSAEKHLAQAAARFLSG